MAKERDHTHLDHTTSFVVLDDGSDLGGVREIDITNSTVTVSGRRVTVTPGLDVHDESVSQGDATILDFRGAGVTAAVAAGTATVTIPGGGGGAGDEPNTFGWMFG